MDQKQEKPFDTVSIILIVMIAGTSDISDVVTDLIVVVPYIGQVAYFGNMLLISPLAWATIQGWFIMKVGFAGKVGLINVAGGVANIIGLPGTTATTVIAIYFVNHPQVAAIAQTATGKVGAGAAGAVKREAAVARGTTLTGMVAEQRVMGLRADTAETTEVRKAAPRTAVSEKGAVPLEALPAEAPPQKAGEEISGEALGEKREPIEEAKRGAFEYQSEEQLAEERKKKGGENQKKAA